MLLCNHIVSIDDCNVLATTDSDFYVKVKKCLLISRDEHLLNRNKKSPKIYLFTYLIDPSRMELCFSDTYYCYSYCINMTIVG